MDSTCSGNLSGRLVREGRGGIAGSEHSLNLGLVSWVRDEVRELLAHGRLRKIVDDIKLLPELLLDGHGCRVSHFNLAETDSLEHSEGGLVALITLQVGELAGSGHDEEAEGWGLGHANKLIELGIVISADSARLNSGGDALLQLVLTVELPHTLEVRLIWESRRHLMGHDHVFSLDDLGGKVAKSLVLTLKGSSTLWGPCVHAKEDILILVGVGEGVEDAVALGLSIFTEEMALVALPVHLGHFVVEHAGTIASEPVLSSEPLKRVGLLTFTVERYRGPFSLKIVHGVVPGLTRVGIDVPTVHVLVLSPVGDAETLEDGPGSAIEGDITDALKQGLGVEVLGIDVMHNVGLLVELVAIDILDAQSYIIIKIKLAQLEKKHDRSREEIWRGKLFRIVV